MKRRIFLCISCIIFITAGLKAQQRHFIYLQTENKQPFYVKLENYILSSSISGYLIVPKLEQGTYNFVVGFPKKEWPEQKFECTVKNADAGYLVKNFGDKGWGLFNLQTLDVSMAGVPAKPVADKDAMKTDEFSRLLSNAVNDPSILEKDVVATPPPPVVKDTVKTGVKEEVKELAPVAVSKPKEEALPAVKDTGKTVAKEEVKEPAPAPAAVNKPTEEAALPETAAKVQDGITKVSEVNGTQQTERTYIIKSNGSSDTVSIEIPVDLLSPKAEPPALKEMETVAIAATEKTPVTVAKTDTQKTDSAKVEKAKADTLVNVFKKDKPDDDNGSAAKEKFLSIDMAAKPAAGTDKKKQPDTVKTTTLKEDTTTVKSVVSLINSDCVSNASDEDFLKLRKKMASASSDEDMLGITKKAFKQRCYSTDQIKNLGVLFLKDEGRYNFFDQAYPHVWDSSNYKQLEGQLTDPYFANRFKAMIRH